MVQSRRSSPLAYCPPPPIFRSSPACPPLGHQHEHHYGISGRPVSGLLSTRSRSYGLVLLAVSQRMKAAVRLATVHDIWGSVMIVPKSCHISAFSAKLSTADWLALPLSTPHLTATPSPTLTLPVHCAATFNWLLTAWHHHHQASPVQVYCCCN